MSHRKTGKAEAIEPGAPAPGSVMVRPARSSDLQSVIALDEEDTGAAKPGYWKERFEWYAGRQPDRFFLIAERGTSMLGFIVGEVRAWEFGSPPSGWIFAIHI